MIMESGLDELYSLRNIPYKNAHEALLQFVGVGPKVADCVCLMSLDKYDCVPVDTHVWQIAQRDYKLGKKFKTLNKIAYDEIRQFFRELWGPYAGWAHSVLFTADIGLELREEPGKNSVIKTKLLTGTDQGEHGLKRPKKSGAKLSVDAAKRRKMMIDTPA
jgi:N-glycosylase/DNA lyase